MKVIHWRFLPPNLTPRVHDIYPNGDILVSIDAITKVHPCH